MRNMTDAAAAQTVARQIRCALFAKLHFLSSIERVWSGYGPLAWNGFNWLGLGTLGQVSMITEDTQLNAQTFTISLSGVDNRLLSEALTEVRQGLPVKFWLAFFDNAGNIVDAPILCYAGRMDQPTILEGTDTSTISISVENRLADLQRRIERRFTDRDQRLEYPADTGLAYIAWTMDWNGAWGTTSK